MTGRVNGASTVRRVRRTKAELAVLDEAIIAAVAADAPVTVRGAFYRVVSAGAVEKSERGYRSVSRRLLELRRNGVIPYRDITDGTRYVLRRPTFDSVEEALEQTARTYRRSLWSTADTHVEIFTEKDAITGVIHPTCDAWQVPLGITRGYSSETFAYEVAASLDRFRPNVVAQLGDHDPSGVNAWDDFKKKVAGFAPDAHVEFVRLAVTPDQIDELQLPTRPTKKSDTRSATWEGGSVEVDAIPANTLRAIVESFIVDHLDHRDVEVLRVAEQSERDLLRSLRGAS